MIHCNHRDIRPSGVGVASPVLDFLAGEFAARIAGVWPAPHAEFLTAPAARRHLICLAFVFPHADGGVDADTVLNRSFKRAIQAVVPEAPRGAARALERLGERAWTAPSYLHLLRLLAIPRSAKLLRHRDSISADEVRALAQLPDPLLEHGLGALRLGEGAATLVAEAFAAIARRDGAEAALALAPRWASAESLQKLVEHVRRDLEPDVAAAPFAGSARLRPILDKAALIDAAARYKNCLRSYLGWASSGASAFYEWCEPPGVVLEITRDRLHGWALNQARLAGNKPVPEPLRTAIIEELRSMGVTVDRTLWQLDNALQDVAGPLPDPVATRAEAIGDLFGN